MTHIVVNGIGIGQDYHKAGCEETEAEHAEFAVRVLQQAVWPNLSETEKEGDPVEMAGEL